MYLTDIISEDSAGSVLDYFKLNSEVGNEEDLTELTQKGNELDIPVMINLDLSSCSVKSPYFEDLLKHANELGKEAALTDLNSEYAQMFSITDEQPNSNWIPLGHSPFFYLGFNGTDAPNFFTGFWSIQNDGQKSHWTLSVFGSSGVLYWRYERILF